MTQTITDSADKENIKLDDHQKWQGRYKGIAFQISKWKSGYTPETQRYDNGYRWNYYIFVKPRKGYKTIKTERAYLPEYVDYSSLYGDVEMHGGITFWARHLNSLLKEIDELGCDYSHIWDMENEGSVYGKYKENTVENVMRDVKDTIDKLPEDLFFQNEN